MDYYYQYKKIYKTNRHTVLGFIKEVGQVGNFRVIISIDSGVELFFFANLLTASSFLLT